jgi:hypothetical protein
MFTKVALLASLCLLAVAIREARNSPFLNSQYVPVSNRYPGLDFPGEDSAVTVELVYDVTCKHSMRKALIL